MSAIHFTGNRELAHDLPKGPQKAMPPQDLLDGVLLRMERCLARSHNHVCTFTNDLLASVNHTAHRLGKIRLLARRQRGTNDTTIDGHFHFFQDLNLKPIIIFYKVFKIQF